MFDWTAERIKELKAYVELGLSCSLIAEEMKLTRNAVIGKIDRLRRKESGKRKGKPRLRKQPVLQSKTQPTVKAVKKIIDKDIPLTQRRTLMELTSDCCRWPVGNPGEADFFFCAAPVEVIGRPYCEGHWQRAHDRPREERRTFIPQRRHAA